MTFTTTEQPAALITGGCRGIGYGIAQVLSAKGFSLALTGMRPKEEVQHSLDKLDNGAKGFYYNNFNVIEVFISV